MGVNAIQIETQCYWATVKEDWANEKYSTVFNKKKTVAPKTFMLNKFDAPKNKACAVIKSDRKNLLQSVANKDVAIPDN